MTSHEDIVEDGKYFFSSLFRERVGCSIPEILKVVELFPKEIIGEMNEALQEVISETEIFSTLSAFQKSKILGPDGLTTDFFLWILWFGEGGFVKSGSRIPKFQKIFRSLNKNFLSLITKKTKLVSFKDFHPISWCNMIYKIISKVIMNRLKPLLSDIISEE